MGKGWTIIKSFYVRLVNVSSCFRVKKVRQGCEVYLTVQLVYGGVREV